MRVLILGGNRFFGRHLAQQLIFAGADVSLLNRGHVDDGFGNQVQRLVADRKVDASLESALRGKEWDLVYDQICYTASEAKAACRLFDGKTLRYVATSSKSVYDDGADQNENQFDPSAYEFTTEASPTDAYQAAKRQMEASFIRHANFEVALVRPSLVVGIDDYTGRLKWHIDRVRNGEPIYFPNLKAQTDFIRSDQAGSALRDIGLSKVTGPVNCTTRGSVSLREIIGFCENAVGKEAVLAQSHIGDTHSPYGGTDTKTMNTTLLHSLGFKANPSPEWLPALINELAN